MQNDLMCKRKVMSWVWSLASNIQTLSGPTFTNLRPRHIGSLSHSSTKGENPAHVHYLRIRGCPLVVGHVVTSWFVRFREAAICSKCWFESGSSPQSFFFFNTFFQIVLVLPKKKKNLNEPGDHNGMIIHLEPDILECEVKWAWGSITTNKASGRDEIPVELFQILKDGAVKALHSICQQIWKKQQWLQDWKRSVFTPISMKTES